MIAAGCVFALVVMAGGAVAASQLIGNDGSGAGQLHPSGSLAPPAAGQEYELEAVAYSCTKYEQTGTTVCAGSVRNISAAPLEGVQVVIEWIDADGAVQSTDRVSIMYNPLLAGQESPWELRGAYNPVLTQFHVSFEDREGKLLTRSAE